MTKVVLVTGGASGSGTAASKRFAAAGAKVVVADLDPRGAEVAAGIGGLFVRADVSREADNEAVVAAAVEAFGGLDVVFLNAGVGNAGGAGEDFNPARYRQVLAVNVDGTMFGVRAALPALIARGGGAIVATSSLGGISPVAFDPVYSASKHAIIGLVRSLAPAWAEQGITINAVCPGFVDTPMISGAVEVLREHGLAVAAADEVAAAVQSVVDGGETGVAWAVQAGQPPARVEFPSMELSTIGGPAAASSTG
jgi:NAD(P)-dependent dehydrogenase (short-subunit alcohol dehydrogenase family)